MVADGASGIWKAVCEAWPEALGQRCTVHKLRNLLAKLPERLHAGVKARYWAALDEATSPTDAKHALAALASDYRKAYPSFAACLHDDLDQLTTQQRFPSEHRKRIRTSNVLERAFVEVHRRTKIIARLPGETSTPSLIWGVREPTSRNWRGVTMTPQAAAHIKRTRRDLTTRDQPPSTRTSPPPNMDTTRVIRVDGSAQRGGNASGRTRFAVAKTRDWLRPLDQVCSRSAGYPRLVSLLVARRCSRSKPLRR